MQRMAVDSTFHIADLSSLCALVRVDGIEYLNLYPILTGFIPLIVPVELLSYVIYCYGGIWSCSTEYIEQCSQLFKI